MLKILKYLKKYTPGIIVVVGLLVFQAYCDLALPTYTSRIVDVGISQGGIDSAVPDVIRESTVNKLLFMLSEEETSLVLSKYTYYSNSNTQGEELKALTKKYPVIETEGIYVLEEKESREELKGIMTKFLAVAVFSNTDIEANLSSYKKPEDLSSISFLGGTLEEGTDAEPEYDLLPESLMEQGAFTAVKEEYTAVGINVSKTQSSYILRAGVKMLALALLGMAATICVGFLSARIAAGYGMDLRYEVFHKVLRFSNLEFDKFSTASLITRSTNDIQQVQMSVVLLLRMVIYAPILAAGGVVKVLNTSTNMAWIIVLGVGLLLLLVGTLLGLSMPKFKLMQTLVDKLNLVTREILTGLSVIRAFSKEKQEEERFDDANKNLTKTNLFVNRTMTFMMPSMMLIMNGITILILWVGGKNIDTGNLQIGSMMAFIQYTMQIIMSFLMLSMLSIILPRASVSGNRIGEVLNTEITIKDPKDTERFLSSSKGYVEFDNVSFQYPKAEDYVLSNISFTAKPGETTAIIGSTGSGKSTLANLIPRFYDVTKGSIKVSGVDVRKLSLHDLREKIGYVPQKGVLFSGTIDSNIRYGKQDATTENIENAASIAQAKEFILEKPEGFHEPISQGGSNVSGGQKQRLSIARAIAKNPEIYVFDDSFSALDYKTDVALRKALQEEIGDSTVIIVAQRISTILHADQIIVLDEGKIVGKGTHKELLKTCEEYYQIASSQLSKEELSYEE